MTTTKAAHTAGPVEIMPRRKGDNIEIRKSGTLNVGPLVYIPHHGAFSDANAALIAEAFNVATEIGMTPRQLAEKLEEETRSAYAYRLSYEEARAARDDLETQRAELLAGAMQARETLRHMEGAEDVIAMLDAAIAKATGDNK